MSPSPAPVWRSLAEVPSSLGPSAVAIGNFDGVHRGHRAVLRHLADAAADRALAAVALTFWPHPRHVCVGPGDPVLLTSRDDRDRLLSLSDLAGVLDLEFTWDFAQYSAEDFVRIFLVEGLGMRLVVMGEDSRFGRANEGDITTMRQLADRYGFEVLTVGDHGLGESTATPSTTRVSSSAIRAALEDGDVPAATAMLGRYPTVTDLVHHGHKRGRELGFPTANLGPAPQGMVPADGVYAGYLTVVRQAPEHHGAPVLDRAPATMSIGTNPTFATPENPSPRIVEAYVHGDHDLDLYGDLVRLELVERQRPTVRFDSVEDLIAQMHLDADVTRRTVAEAERSADLLG
ncbi:MAG: bifunctional riboflavin kinase/FAD synthetase [Brachybacterium sp.]|nr:bifunctional riboflavin kinase/FAD synthetase [Brachybacterium sp.]